MGFKGFGTGFRGSRLSCRLRDLWFGLRFIDRDDAFWDDPDLWTMQNLVVQRLRGVEPLFRNSTLLPTCTVLTFLVFGREQKYMLHRDGIPC